ncbi:MAG: hypothetical protein LBJ64_10460 [Deltaproteobacteria bacterium]|nr:hypothetical protein [Deltaproteobacteria bacterium]
MKFFAAKDKKSQSSHSDEKSGESFDRQGYFREIRNDFLNKLGLPAGTKPEQVLRMMEIRKELDKIKNKRRRD